MQHFENLGQRLDYLYCMYADDTDFISSFLYADQFITQLKLLEVLKRYNLKVNLAKTEFTKFAKDTVHVPSDEKKSGEKKTRQHSIQN